MKLLALTSLDKSLVMKKIVCFQFLVILYSLNICGSYIVTLINYGLIIKKVNFGEFYVNI